jgi:hypothetical protein
MHHVKPTNHHTLLWRVLNFNGWSSSTEGSVTMQEWLEETSNCNCGCLPVKMKNTWVTGKKNLWDIRCCFFWFVCILQVTKICAKCCGQCWNPTINISVWTVKLLKNYSNTAYHTIWDTQPLRFMYLLYNHPEEGWQVLCLTVPTSLSFPQSYELTFAIAFRLSLQT